MKVMIPFSHEILQRIAIAFVDDTDFFSTGRNAKSQMQQIMDVYTHLYEATGGKLQKEKIFSYSWKWIMKKGVKLLTNKPNKLIIKNHNVIQKPNSDATRTLGVWFAPNLTWDKQFEVMCEKLRTAMRKLMNTKLFPYQIHLYFNICQLRLF